LPFGVLPGLCKNKQMMRARAIINDIREPAIFWLDAHFSGTGTGKGSTNTSLMKERVYFQSQNQRSCHSDR
jgi:hypothetical protein